MKLRVVHSNISGGYHIQKRIWFMWLYIMDSNLEKIGFISRIVYDTEAEAVSHIGRIFKANEKYIPPEERKEVVTVIGTYSDVHR